MDILESLFISVIFMASVLWISLWYDYEFSFFSFTAYSKLYASVEGSGWWLTLHIRCNLWLSTVKAGNLNQNKGWDYSNLVSLIFWEMVDSLCFLGNKISVLRAKHLSSDPEFSTLTKLKCWILASEMNRQQKFLENLHK